MNPKKVLLLALFFISQFSIASHIVGGEFQLIHISDSTYRLEIHLYYDLINGSRGAFGQTVYAKIFRKNDNSLMEVVYLSPEDQELVDYVTDECTAEGIETIRFIKSAEIKLPPEVYNDPGGYYIAWESCCRNYVIDNIYSEDPNATSDSRLIAGQTFYLEFPAVQKNGEPFINSSPNLSKPISDYACVNVPFWFDFSGSDPDGDSLAYTLVTPLGSDVLLRGIPLGEIDATQPEPYPEVIWKGTYSLDNVMGGQPNLTINRNGLMSVTPSTQGLFVFSVRCDEYRDGVKIGEVRRDYQLYVIDDCNFPNSPTVEGKASFRTNYNQGILEVIFDETNSSNRCIDIQISDLDSGIPDDFTENVNIEVFPINFDNDTLSALLPDSFNYQLVNNQTINFDICFPECPLIDPEIEEYVKFGILAFDDYCPVPLTDTLEVRIKIEPPLNNSPIAQIEDSQEDFFIEVVESNGGFLELDIVGSDVDEDDLELTVVPIGGFNPELAGMNFTTPNFSAGNVNTRFTWNFDCNGNNEYSEGINISNATEQRRMYNFLVIVDDYDHCGFDRSDTVKMDLIIRFPEEYPPQIFLSNDPLRGNYSSGIYELGSEVNLEVSAVDQFPDTDNISIRAAGDGFDINDYDIDFNGVVNAIGVEPGSTATFSWNLDCSQLNGLSTDTLGIFFIAEDLDFCSLTSADTLRYDIVLDKYSNTPPEFAFEDEQGILYDEDLIEIIYPNDVFLRAVATDIDEDSVFIELVSIEPYIGTYTKEESNNFKEATSEFVRDFQCELLNGNIANEYTLTYLAYDNSCLGADSTTLEVTLNLVNSEDIDPSIQFPNVFSPNNDGLNDTFTMKLPTSGSETGSSLLPPDNCVYGDFEGITIMNRWGNEIYFSDNRDFEWEGANTSGVYYYIIKYTNTSFKGTVTEFR